MDRHAGRSFSCLQTPVDQFSRVEAQTNLEHLSYIILDEPLHVKLNVQNANHN